MELNMKRRKGFTLVEVILVITILGILSSVAFMKFGGVQKRAEENADYVAASNLATAINLAKSEKFIDSGVINLVTLKNNGYITEIPKPQSVTDAEFIVKMDNEEIIVELNNKQIYPKIPKQPTNPEEDKY